MSLFSKIVNKAVGWTKKHSGYDKFSDEIANGVKWIKKRSGFDKLAGELNNGVRYLKRRSGYDKISLEIKRAAYDAGSFLGRKVAGNFKGDFIYAGIGIVFAGPLSGRIAAVDILSGGAFSKGFYDRFYSPSANLESAGSFLSSSEKYGYEWFAGSSEWNGAMPGGYDYCSTGIYEPWQVMNGLTAKTDFTGLLMNNFYDSNAPAAPFMNYAGSADFYSI